MRVAVAVLALGCADPFLNDPPRLVSVNGVELVRRRGELRLPARAAPLRVTPGERLWVTLELADPDGDPVDVWWPRAPVGWVFEPDAVEGYWDVPSDAAVGPVELILRDQHPENPRTVGYDVPLWAD